MKDLPPYLLYTLPFLPWVLRVDEVGHNNHGYYKVELRGKRDAVENPLKDCCENQSCDDSKTLANSTCIFDNLTIRMRD